MSFFRPHLDYCNIIYNQAYHASFQQKVESVQYIAALAISGAIRGTSKENLFSRARLGVSATQAVVQKLCCFCTVLKNLSQISF